LKQPERRPTARGIFVIGWTGMRGVIALAAAISLPQTIGNGQPFPQRNVIIFLTFCIIFVTLVVQGLSLPSLIRFLGLAEEKVHSGEEDTARKKMLRAALLELDRLRAEEGEERDKIYDDLGQYYKLRLASIDDSENGRSSSDSSDQQQRYLSLSHQLRKVERSTLIQLRDEDQISENVLRALERELDFLDARAG
jgi:monovalent cation/hydrogen antiporter